MARRKNDDGLGSALADSGLLYEAIDDLMAENHESCYGAFSLLFLVAKAGVVEPLTSVIEKHPSLDLSLAVIRLLASSGEPEVRLSFATAGRKHFTRTRNSRRRRRRTSRIHQSNDTKLF